jgi:hypothetical protein
MKRAATLPLLLATLGLFPAEATAQKVSPEEADFSVRAREIVVDDVWFKGSAHSAFEGIPVPAADNRWKPGNQGILRTKAVLTGAGTTTSAMTLEFELGETPRSPVKVLISGLDDRAEAANTIVVTVNGRQVGEPFQFPRNRNADEGIPNDRFLMGWEDREVVLPAGSLKKGKNTLTIANTTSCFDAEKWNYAVVDRVKLVFGEEVDFRIPRLERLPVLYYGLDYGPEVNAWPAVNLDNRITLLQDTPLQVVFFVTLPSGLPLGKEGPLVPPHPGEKAAFPDGGNKEDGGTARKNPPTAKPTARDIRLHLEVEGDMQILTKDGEEVSRSDDGTYSFPLPRLVSFETPHPAQGVTLFLRGGKPFDGHKLTAWVSVDGVPYRKTEYQLRNIALEPLADRDALKFDLGIWGGQIPTEEKAMREYITTAKRAGFNQLFTGDNQTLNTALKKAGFHVYPRFGWFGHQFKVTDETAQFAAIDINGQPMPKDFCPLAILANPDHPEVGKFFKRARKYASQTDIDGICVDYETAPVWCYCDQCLTKFREETGQPDVTREQILPGGPQAGAFADYGRRRNRDLLAKVKEIIREQNPRLEYHSLASASDIPSYWYDGRTGARHSARELTTFADAIYASGYFYEVPGGLKSVIPIIETVNSYARNSRREVGTYIISPVATTISEFPRYRGAWMKPDFTRMMIQLAAFGGARGVLLFRGDCLDGEYFEACREAMASLIQARDYLEKGINRSHEVTMTPVPVPDRQFATETAEHLLSRLIWRPAETYEYDVVQLVEDNQARRRLVALFNYSQQPREYHVAIRGLFDPEYTLTDFSTKESLGTMGRQALEHGRWKITVPARSCRLVEITAQTP